MTQRYAAATAPSRAAPLFSWLFPRAAMIAAAVGFAVIAVTFGPSRPVGGKAVTATDMPSIGSIAGASLAIGERPFAYLEFDWEPAAGIPGFDLRQDPFRLVADASAG